MKMDSDSQPSAPSSVTDPFEDSGLPDPGAREDDARRFAKAVRRLHRRINPCFMTGKGCVHTEHIDSELEHRQSLVAGFNVRPFQPNIEAAHRLTVERFLRTHYSTPECELQLGEADKVRRTGYVVCEKICRRIQASDFILVDVSAPNANVFYELGLAYGIDQKILLIYQESSAFGRKAASYLQDGGCRAFPYRDLDPIRPEDFVLANYLWTRHSTAPPAPQSAPTIALITRSYGFIAWEATQNDDSIQASGLSCAHNGNSSQTSESQPIDCVLGPQDIDLGFETHVRAAVGVAVDNIVESLRRSPPRAAMRNYIDLVGKLKHTRQTKKDAGFQEVRQEVEQSFCTIIQTGGTVSDPMAYFWLGYCHALGKNVIPVTVVNKLNDGIDDLAFDLRALWHMSFAREAPTRFSQELEETLHQMITSDFAEWSRRKFWDEVLGRRGKVSIFTGALHNGPIGREMIGDWDLRAASELTSYLARQQYRATIESPVYQIEQVTGTGGSRAAGVTEQEYIAELEQMLCGKNCIVIASPDVNPLTEILLGKLYRVPSDNWFKSVGDVKKKSGAVVAFKEVRVAPEDLNEQGRREDGPDTPDLARAFYQRIATGRPRESGEQLKRGFLGHGVAQGKLQGEFLSQTDGKQKFSVHAHLVVARNPFDLDSDEPHHVIILNGVSGPATFALTHVLTGGTSGQFVDYDSGFLPESESECFLQDLNRDLVMLRERFLGLQYFFLVEVGPAREAPDDRGASGRDIFDWRRIISWKPVPNSSECAFGQAR